MYGQGLKPLAELTLREIPSWGSYLPDDGEPMPLTLEAYHGLVASLALDPPVDLIVHPVFDVARNLLLYAWFERSFVHPAELQAFGCLELGLRLHVYGIEGLKQRRSNLKKLLKRAVQLGSLRDECIGPYPRLAGFGRAWSRETGVRVPDPGTQVAPRPYVEVLCDAIPAVRNRFAHGHPGWAGTAFATLSTCRDLLNCLGPFGSKPPSESSDAGTRNASSTSERSHLDS